MDDDPFSDLNEALEDQSTVRQSSTKIRYSQVADDNERQKISENLFKKHFK